MAIISAGEATISLPVPTKVDLSADDLVGYWFAPESFDLSAGSETFRRTITATRAGVIHGKITPSPAFENYSLTILPIVLKPPAGLTIKDVSSGDYRNLSSQNDYVTPPLPFGGTYAVIVSAGASYFVSDSAMVDAEHPIVVRDLALQLPAGAIRGQFVDEASQPIRYQEVMLTYHPTGNDALVTHLATTAADGSFTIANINFAVPGNYEVQPYDDQWEKSVIRIDGQTPQPVVIALRHRRNE